MQCRCTIHIGDAVKKLVLASRDTETTEHLALKLAAFILLLKWEPVVDLSAKNPAIASQEFRPDMASLNDAGEVRLWAECGTVATYKLDKLIRRFRNARLVAFKENPREARNLRNALEKNEVPNHTKIEILAFPDGQFEEWMKIMDDSIEVYGESSEHGFNLVANDTPFCFDFVRL
jgi:uncharacterized protein YaeQ